MSDFAGTSASPTKRSTKTPTKTSTKTVAFSTPTTNKNSPKQSKKEAVQKIVNSKHPEEVIEGEVFDQNVISYEMLNDPGFALTLEPVRDIIRDVFQLLTWAELWSLHSNNETSLACKRALTEYLRGLQKLHVNAAHIHGMTRDQFLILLQYTSILQSFTTDGGLNSLISEFIDHNVLNTLFMKNQHLQALGAISAVAFDEFLTPRTPISLVQFDSLNLLHLRRLHLFFPKLSDLSNRHFDNNRNTIMMFFLRLEESCPSISSLEIRNDDAIDIIVNSDSLSYISRLPLEIFEAENITFTVRFNHMLSACPQLKRLVLHGDEIDDHIVEDAARLCTNLEHFYVYCDHPNRNATRDYCKYATDLIESNRKLQSFSYLNNQLSYDTCDADTLDVMTDALADLKELSFYNEQGFHVIGESFIDVVEKFQNLYKLILHSGFISQRWLDVIGENCSNLLELHLKEKYEIPIDSPDDIGGKNITAICSRNEKLESLYLHFKRDVTSDGCRAIARLNLKFLVIILPPSTNSIAIETTLGVRYHGIEITRNMTRNIISYIQH